MGNACSFRHTNITSEFPRVITNSTNAQASPPPPPSKFDAQGIIPSVDDAGPEILVLCIDIGTTGSGVAYAYRNAQGQTVFLDLITRWPSQAVNSSKVPSLLVYDQRGAVRAWGAACNQRQYSNEVLAREGLLRCEWFKLWITTTTSGSSDAVPSHELPAGATPFSVWGDFLACIYKAALAEMQAKRSLDQAIARLRAERKFKVVLTIPVRWRRDGTGILRQLRIQAERAKIIDHVDSTELEFLSEAEASALFGLHELHAPLKPDSTFVVVDAGGGTVDCTAYRVRALQPKLDLAELSTANGIFAGSTFIDKAMGSYLQQILQTRFWGQWGHHHITDGVANFTTEVKPSFRMEDQQPIYLKLGSRVEFDDGCLELRWNEVRQVFDTCVDRIVQEAEATCSNSPSPANMLFLVGGLGSNKYLASRLRIALPYTNVIQPDDINGGSKAVALGGWHHILTRAVGERCATAHYGIEIYVPWLPLFDGRYPAHRKKQGKDGNFLLAGKFEPVIAKGQRIGVNEPYVNSFKKKPWKSGASVIEDTVTLYYSEADIKPEFVDDGAVSAMCDVVCRYHVQKDWKEFVSPENGRPYWEFVLQVALYFGQTELVAELRGRDMTHGRVVLEMTPERNV